MKELADMRINRYGWTVEMALTKKGHHLDLHKS